MSEVKWSKYQLDIFEEVIEGTEHLIVEACPGSGKTKTIVGSLDRLPPMNNWIVVTFTKKVAQEMKEKAPDTGDVYNLHALGLKYIFRAFPKIKVNLNKLKDLLESRFPGYTDSARELRNSLSQAVNYCKYSLISESSAITELLKKHKIVIDLSGFSSLTPEEVILDLLETTRLDLKQVDQTDMIWFPIVWSHRVKLPVYDSVFIDELQDLNQAQIAMVLLLMGKSGKIYAFGDSDQAIFGFICADDDALGFLKKKLKAKVMPLSISYRCSKAIVKEAQKLVPEMEAAPDAIEGKVASISLNEMKKQAKPGCFILSRINAPLVDLALDFLSRDIPCNIQGKDLGDGLISLIKKSKCKSVVKFLSYIEKWANKEIKKLTDKGEDTADFLDKIECLKLLCNKSSSIDGLILIIQNLFEDKDDISKIVCSSVHKAKGLERDIVFILSWTLRSIKNEEEKHIKFVAITRAAQELYFVFSDKNTKMKKTTALDEFCEWDEHEYNECECNEHNETVNHFGDDIR